MRIAIHNPFTGSSFAETELSRRIYLAAQNLGWTAAEVSNSVEIRQFVPDFVLVMHSNEGKLTEYPTYGCMWNPPALFERKDQAIQNILSYDGYLTSGATIDRWLNHLLYCTNKPYFTTPFYTSCPRSDYRAPNLTNPRLVYLGSNWDGSRFPALFAALDSLDDVDVYGSPEGWQYLQQTYRGPLPYDGVSVLNTLNQAGVGLCLHKDRHCQAGVPSMRIFEIAASGAIAICGEHSFIREAFGDAVLYVDTDSDIADQVEQIQQHMAWIKAHPDAALEMSAAAHTIFLQRYTLEELLLNIVPHHQALIRQKGFVQTISNDSDSNISDRPLIQLCEQPEIQIVVKPKQQELAAFKQSLESIAAQSYRQVSAIVVQPEGMEGLDTLLNQYDGKLKIQRIKSERSPFSSTHLWAGLRAVDSDYVAILNSGDVIYPNHCYLLLSALKQSPDAGVIYAGAARKLEDDRVNEQGIIEPLELAYFQPFEPVKLLSFEPFIAGNSFIAKTSLIQPILERDPQLQVAEDLFLLLYLSQKTAFAFNYESTCEFNYRFAQPTELNAEQNSVWVDEISHLKLIFWRQGIASGKSFQTVFNEQREQRRLRNTVTRLENQLERSRNELADAHEQITAMESSKFWKLRAAWFKLKRSLGMPVE